ANDTYLDAHRDEPFSVIVQSNGHLCYAAQATLKNETVLINIPLERFPTGIAQAVLFDRFGKPISERLIFVENLRPVDIKISTNKNTYSIKEPVELQILTRNNDSTFAGNYSISVVDESKVNYPENKEHTILSSFLLTSELKGYIEQPNYYFNAENSNREEALDALLM